MPVIETETITRRRKIVAGRHRLENYAEIRVTGIYSYGIDLIVSSDDDAGSWNMDAPALREAAALLTEMADILEKGE